MVCVINSSYYLLFAPLTNRMIMPPEAAAVFHPHFSMHSTNELGEAPKPFFGPVPFQLLFSNLSPYHDKKPNPHKTQSLPDGTQSCSPIPRTLMQKTISLPNINFSHKVQNSSPRLHAIIGLFQLTTGGFPCAY